MPRLLFWLAGLAAWMAAGEAQQAPYRPVALASELRRLETVVRSGAQVQNQLPAEWEVETPQRNYAISTEPVRDLLSAGKGEQAQRWLGMLAQQLEGFEAAPAAAAGARAKLDRILARREFGGTAQPNAMERLRRRIAEWVQEWLRRLFSAIGEHSNVLGVLFWVVVAGCVGFLALWLLRWWTREAALPALPGPGGAATEVRSWQQWLASARRAGEEGDWRQAIHCGYWSGVSRLQESGALPADLTHTPREFLRLMSDEPDARESLAALTSGLERFWYAQRAAGAEDFRESVKHLETLGCRVE